MAQDEQAQQPFPNNWLIGQDWNPNEHLLQLKGKDYLTVQDRLLWFIRDQRALIVAGLAKVPYVVQTDLVEMDRGTSWAHFKTYVRDVLGNEATMYGSESAKDFADYAEKASTKSLGRALLALGYGTAFAPEMDEGERVVDSPVERRATSSNNASASQTTTRRQPAQAQQSAPQQQQPQQPKAVADLSAQIVAPPQQKELALKIREAGVASDAKVADTWFAKHVRSADAPKGPIDVLRLQAGTSNINMAELQVALETLSSATPHGTSTGHAQESAPTQAQQKSIEKLCSVMGKKDAPQPRTQTEARAVIAHLSAEYQEMQRHRSTGASEPARAY